MAIISNSEIQIILVYINIFIIKDGLFMLKQNIENLLLNYNLPVYRGDKSVYEFLKQYFEGYANSLEQVIRQVNNPEDFKKQFYDGVKKALPYIKNLCKDILQVFMYYHEGKFTELYPFINEMMTKDEYQQFFRVLFLGEGNLYYRVRTNEKQKDYDRKGLFHIPFDKRHLSKSCRYSILSGAPCLYLGTKLGLTWAECGMPRGFSYSVFKLQSGIKLFHMGKSIAKYLEEYRKNPDDKENRIKILQYIVTYPIRVACSIAVKDKSSANPEEYVFPQLLLSWIKEYGHYDGISYLSSSTFEESNKYGKEQEQDYYNIGLPATQFNLNDGICEKLRNMFKISSPENIDLKELINKFNEEIESVRNVIQDLSVRLQRVRVAPRHSYRQVFALCKWLLFTCDSIVGEDIKNMESIYNTISAMEGYAWLLHENHDSIRQEVLDEKNVFKGQDKEWLKEDIDTVIDGIEKIFRAINHLSHGFYLENHPWYRMSKFDYESV